MRTRKIFDNLLKRMKEPRKFIQVLLGPRQVGKTTLSLQLEKKLKIPSTYISADTATLEDLTWLEMQWESARQTVEKEALLIIDEVQKIPNWSSLVKKLWDLDTRNQINLKVVILGSSPWLMQRGLSESLAGRFEILPITHWNYQEMRDFFDISLDEYVFFGGYPGPVSFIKENDFQRWLNYVNDALIETTISRDILLMTQVNKPILLRRLFQLGCNYSSQILSYQKMLGQLQDAGNTTTLAHYLELLAGAGVLTGVYKYTNQSIRNKSSSPKFQVYNTALMTAQSNKTLQEAKKDRVFWGRLVESCVGAYLVNNIRGTQINLYYWREQNMEVDFVLKKGDSITAIEVKSSPRKEKLSGMNAFVKAYNPSKVLLVGEQGIPLEKFLSSTIDKWIS
ncbi:AAA family ATPase [Candidatus Aerophobetes bacterium]|uniref:AAA family ATPase n=1 Tax=Aerophobetes bacterium TaxID=2030807 RepID=A0A2A4YCU6_UNCAE|nr:MAG: AAA family ATPase [Candidatus Aerophobetes bacterium]